MSILKCVISVHAEGEYISGLNTSFYPLYSTWITQADCFYYIVCSNATYFRGCIKNIMRIPLTLTILERIILSHSNSHFLYDGGWGMVYNCSDRVHKKIKHDFLRSSLNYYSSSAAGAHCHTRAVDFLRHTSVLLK